MNCLGNAAMNADLLLNHFDRIAEAPDAIPRLRRFILDLAVRGKLVEQDPNDEPVAILLERIRNEKIRRVKMGILREQKSSLSIQNNEKEFNLPKGWKWVRLAEVIKLWNGFAFKSTDYKEFGVPVIRIGDLQSGQVKLTRAVCVSDDVADNVNSEIWIPPDALLIAMSGATTGKVAFNLTGRRLLLNQRVGRIEAFFTNIYFIKFFFETIVSLNLAISFGTAIPNLSSQQIYNTVIALPPLAEQHRIVAKVDELMALCDQLETANKERETRRDQLVASSLNRLSEAQDSITQSAVVRFHLDHFPRLTIRPEHIKQLRQAILNLAVRGRLVPQDPNDEPAGELLKKIQEEKARLIKNGEIRKEKLLPSFEMNEILYSLPVGWKWVPIRQVTSDRGQTIPIEDFTYIDVTAINKEVGCIADPKILAATNAPSRARKLVKKGDVIYSCVRPYLLNIAIIDSDIIPRPIASTAFAVLNGFGLILPKYIWIVLRSPFVIEFVEVKMRGQAYPAINDSDFSLLPFPLPPLAEQHRIVAKVDELMALCDQLESANKERETRQDQLLKSVLHQALGKYS